MPLPFFVLFSFLIRSPARLLTQPQDPLVRRGQGPGRHQRAHAAAQGRPADAQRRRSAGPDGWPLRRHHADDDRRRRVAGRRRQNHDEHRRHAGGRHHAALVVNGDRSATAIYHKIINIIIGGSGGGGCSRHSGHTGGRENRGLGSLAGRTTTTATHTQSDQAIKRHTTLHQHNIINITHTHTHSNTQPHTNLLLLYLI